MLLSVIPITKKDWLVVQKWLEPWKRMTVFLEAEQQQRKKECFFPRLYIGCLKIREKSLWRKKAIKRNTSKETQKSQSLTYKKPLGVISMRKRKKWIKDCDCTACSQRSSKFRRPWMWQSSRLHNMLPQPECLFHAAGTPATQLTAMI